MMSERASLFKEGNVIRVEQKVSDRDIMHMLFLSKSIKKKLHSESMIMILKF